MIRLTIFLLTLSVLTLSCDSKKYWEPSYLASLEKQRSLAAAFRLEGTRYKPDYPDTCFQDRLNPQGVKDLIKETLAKKAENLSNDLDNVKEVPEGWHPVEAHLANKNRHYINPNPFQTSCKSLSCLYNMTYQRSDNGLSGLFSAYWLIQTGWPIRVTRPGREENILNRPVTWHLFSRKELEALAKIASILPFSGSQVPTLGFLVKGDLPTGDAGNAVTFFHRLSDGSAQVLDGSKGYIVLADSANHEFHGESFFEQIMDYFFHTWTHELGHHVDRSNVIYPADYSSFSEHKSWLELSGWERVQTSDPESNETREEWVFDVSGNVFLSFTGLSYENQGESYAATSPAEDFAEHFSFYRWYPLAFQEDSPKYAFLRDSVFNGVEFTPSKTADRIIEEVVNDFLLRFPKVSMKCFEGAVERAVHDSDKPFLSNVFEGISHPLNECFADITKDVIDTKLKEISSTRWHGCEYIHGDSTINLKNRLSEELENELPRLVEYVTDQAFLQESMDEIEMILKENIDASELFLECYSEEESEKCYILNLKKAFREEARGFPDIPHNIEAAIQKRYLTKDSFKNIEKLTRSRYLRLFKGLNNSLSASADQSIARCEAAFEPSSDGAHSLDYQASKDALFLESYDHYLDPGFESCLMDEKNTFLKSDFLINQASGYSIQDDPHSQYLGDLIFELWFEQVLLILDTNRSVAIEKSVEEQASIVDQVSNALIDDSDWIRNNQGRSAYEQCKWFSKDFMTKKGVFKKSFTDQIFIYESRAKIESDVARKVCNRVRTDPQYKVVLSDSRLRKQELLLSELKRILENEYKKIEGSKCDGYVSSLIKKIAGSCALSHSHTMISNAYNEWKELPITKSFFNSPSQAWRWLSDHAYDLLKSIDEDRGSQ